MLDSPSEVVVLLQSLQEEVDGLSLPLLQIGRTTHGSDAHDTIRQWNHPHPTVVEAIDADIAGVFAGAVLDIAKVTKDCSALVLIVFTTQALFGRQERIASRCIHYILSRDPVTSAIL